MRQAVEEVVERPVKAGSVVRGHGFGLALRIDVGDLGDCGGDFGKVQEYASPSSAGTVEYADAHQELGRECGRERERDVVDSGLTMGFPESASLKLGNVYEPGHVSGAEVLRLYEEHDPKLGGPNRRGREEPEMYIQREGCDGSVAAKIS